MMTATDLMLLGATRSPRQATTCLIEKGAAHVGECYCNDCIETRVLLGEDIEREWRLILTRILLEQEEPCTSD